MQYDVEKFTAHLAEMIRYPTVSTADPAQSPKAAFAAMQAALAQMYPLVFGTLEREVLGESALLLRWKGTGASGKQPLLVMAHQDVVAPGDLGAWKHPPFDPFLDEDGVLWGRGATDCKNTMLFELEALEGLIGDGFVPTHDVYAIFGYNEEIMGGEAAACRIIVEELKRRGVRFGMVVDEGAGYSVRDGRKIAEISVGEKGYADYEFRVEQAGGHAAMPPKHNALGELGYAMWQLEEHPMAPYQSAPALRMFRAMASCMPAPMDTAFAAPEQHWDEVAAYCLKDPLLSTAVRTTVTPTMAAGSAQANILPERATVVANCRILPGQTMEDLEAHFREVLPENVQFRLLKGTNPPPASPDDNWAYRLLQKVTRQLHGEDVLFVPNLIFAGTDSRYYCEICDSVYRYNAGDSSKKSGGAHQVNEHIDTATLCSGVEFFYRLTREYGNAE